MIAVVFAVPQESRAFRARLQHASTVTTGAGGVAGSCTIGNVGREEVVVFHTGIGCAAVERMLPGMLAEHRPSWLISAGFAGALDPALEVGDLVAESALSSPALLAMVPETVVRARFATVEQPAANAAEKRALREATGAAAVDMESRAVVAACAAARVPVLILRVISDDAEMALPLDFASTWDAVAQRPRIPAIVRSLADQPEQWTPFASFVRDLDRAASRLAEAIAGVIR